MVTLGTQVTNGGLRSSQVATSAKLRTGKGPEYLPLLQVAQNGFPCSEVAILEESVVLEVMNHFGAWKIRVPKQPSWHELQVLELDLNPNWARQLRRDATGALPSCELGAPASAR